ncbi:hypothetical protein Q5752_000644 [Cryptotrichosporon argae]
METIDKSSFALSTASDVALFGQTFSLFSVYGPVMIGVLLSVFGLGIIVLWFIDLHLRPEEVLSPLLGLFSSTIVQAFLAHRCILFSRILHAPDGRATVSSLLRKWVLTVVLSAGVVITFIGGFGASVYLTKIPTYIQAARTLDPHGTFQTFTTLWLTTSSLTDVMLAAVLIYELRSAVVKSRNRMINALIRIAVQSGAIVTAIQLATLVVYFAGRSSADGSSWALWGPIFISKVYAITLIAALVQPREAARTRLALPLPPPQRRTTPTLPAIVAMPHLEDEWSTRPGFGNNTFGPYEEYGPYSRPEHHVPSPAAGDGQSERHILQHELRSEDGDVVSSEDVHGILSDITGMSQRHESIDVQPQYEKQGVLDF